MKSCSLEGCLSKFYARKMCKNHYRHLMKHGDPLIVKRGGGSRGLGPDHPGWKDRDITYRSAHMRVQRLRGKADTHTCCCGQQAKDWSYDYTDPFELTGLNGKYPGVYSPDVDRYAPMCRSCHRQFDKEHDGQQSCIRAVV